MMSLDKKMLGEINSAVDGFVKKNRMSLENAKAIDTLKKDIKNLGDRINQAYKDMDMVATHVDKSRYKDVKMLLGRIEKLEKAMKKK